MCRAGRIWLQMELGRREKQNKSKQNRKYTRSQNRSIKKLAHPQAYSGDAFAFPMAHKPVVLPGH